MGDIVIIETQSMNMIPNYDPYATLVFQANPHNVETTIVNGKIIVENRQIRTYDIRKNVDQIKKWIDEIKPFASKLANKK